MSDSTLKSRWDWCVSRCVGNLLLDKKQLRDHYIRYMLSRTQQIFEWDGLPESIPQREIERILQVNANTFVMKAEGYNVRIDKVNQLFAFDGGLGGVQNEYYLPTIYTISNPYLNFTTNAKIGIDGVLIWNDSYMTGLLPMFERYASLLAECDVTLRFGVINARIRKLITANDDVTKKSAEQFLADIEEGKKLGVIATEAFFEGASLKSEDYTSTNTADIKAIIELKQYLQANWWIELGLNSNYNMKREAINSSESGMNNDILLPLVDDMLECRQKGAEEINKLFGTNISVKLKSSWQYVREEAEATLDNITDEGQDGSEPQSEETNEEESKNDTE